MDQEQDELWPGNRVQADPPLVVNADDERYDRFVEGYFIFRGNQTKAAVYAGYSKDTAYSQGSRLMRRPAIAAKIAARAQELKLEYGIERVLDEVARGALADPRRVVHEDGTPMRLHELDEDTARALESFELDEAGRLVKFKFLKRSGLDGMMRYHGLFNDKIAHSVRVSLEDLIVGKDADAA